MPRLNKKHSARDLGGLGRIVRPPKRRGINEPQIAVDQRAQAICITMAYPGCEAFSIRAPGTCAVGLHVVAKLKSLTRTCTIRPFRSGRVSSLGNSGKIGAQLTGYIREESSR